MKTHFDCKVGIRTDFSEDAMLKTWLSAIAKVTTQDWAKTVEHVDQLLYQAWVQEAGKDVDKTDYSQFKFTVNDEDDDEDENVDEWYEDDGGSEDDDHEETNWEPAPCSESWNLLHLMEKYFPETPEDPATPQVSTVSKRRLNFQVCVPQSHFKCQETYHLFYFRLLACRKPPLAARKL